MEVKRKTGDSYEKKRARRLARAERVSEFDPDRLEFPANLAPHIGLCKEEINKLKTQGCPFFKNKTTGRWVRAFIAKQAGAESLLSAAPLESE